MIVCTVYHSKDLFHFILAPLTLLFIFWHFILSIISQNDPLLICFPCSVRHFRFCYAIIVEKFGPLKVKAKSAVHTIIHMAEKINKKITGNY